MWPTESLIFGLMGNLRMQKGSTPSIKQTTLKSLLLWALFGFVRFNEVVAAMLMTSQLSNRRHHLTCHLCSAIHCSLFILSVNVVQSPHSMRLLGGLYDVNLVRNTELSCTHRKFESLDYLSESYWTTCFLCNFRFHYLCDLILSSPISSCSLFKK